MKNHDMRTGNSNVCPRFQNYAPVKKHLVVKTLLKKFAIGSGVSLSLIAGAAGSVWAQNTPGTDNRLLLPPLNSPDAPMVAPPSVSPPALRTPQVSPPTLSPPAVNPPSTSPPVMTPRGMPVPPAQNHAAQQDDEEKPLPYQFPQRHNFQQPVQVGPDQLRHHTGYWQPGGYQPRDGSPFFNSVPGAPPRGPIAGGGGDSSTNPAASPQAGGYAYPQQNGLGLPGLGQPLGILPQHSAHGLEGFSGYNMGGFANSALGGSGAGAGPGGDPYEYHFGPGYYRSGEYGHYRFPYYSYRRPWFHPGFSGYNRDVNLPW